MKKIFKIYEKLFVLLAALLPFIVSCDVGLGASVDIMAPTIDISYPPSGSIIRDDFVLAGSWADDIGVMGINVTMKNTNTGDSVFTGNATVNGAQWTMPIDGRQYRDGSYEVTVVAVDASGKSSGVSSRSFDIDNTPPFFIIQKPGVVLSSSGKEAAYGSRFSVSGTIADIHEVAQMSLDIYDESGRKITDSGSSDLSKNFVENSIATAGGTDVSFASCTWTGSVEDARYITMYSDRGSRDAPNTIDKKFSCTVTLRDNAKEYKNPGDDGSGSGNSTTKVWLYDDVYTQYMSSSSGLGLSASDMMNIFSGASTNGGLSKSTLESVGKNTAESGNRLKFSLNPSANPTYVINGVDVFSGKNPSENSLANNSNVSLNVSAGLNNTAVKPNTVHVWMMDMGTGEYSKDTARAKVTEIESKAASLRYLADGNVNPNFVSDMETYFRTLYGSDTFWCVKDNSGDTSASGTQFVVSFNMPSCIMKDRYYILVATGCDLDKLEFGQNTLFGFKGSGTGKLPSIKINSPSNLSYFATSAYDGTSGLKYSFTADKGDRDVDRIEVKIVAKNEETGAVVGTMTGTIAGIAGASNNYEFVPSYTDNRQGNYGGVKCEAGAEKSYLYSATFKVYDKEGQSAEATNDVHIDTVTPKPTITSITPIITDYDDKTNVNGVITVKGNIEETNLVDATFKLYEADSDGNPVGNPKETKTVSKPFSFTQTFDTVKVSGSNGNKPFVLVVEAKDSVGNIGTTNSTVFNKDIYPAAHAVCKAIMANQETDRPVIKPSNFEDEVAFDEISADKNLFTKTGSMKFSVTDDDGTVPSSAIKTSWRKESGGSWSTPTIGNTVYLNSLEEGKYEIKITVTGEASSGTDTGCKDTEKTYRIAVSAGAPEISVSESTGAFKKGASVPVKITLDNKSNASATATLTQDARAVGASPYTLTGKGTVSAKVTANDSLTVDATDDKKTVTVTYKVTDQYGQTNSEKFSYVVDNKVPAVNITSVTPTVTNPATGENPYVNGTIKVTFNASDNYDLKQIDWECEGESDDALKGTITDDKRFGDTIEIDTTKIATGSTKKDLKIIIKATDSAGNTSEATKSYIVWQESDRPVIAPTNFEEGVDFSDINVDKNLFSKTGSIRFNVTDDDSAVDSSKIKVSYAKSSAPTSFTDLGTGSSVSLATIPSDGEYIIKIKAEGFKEASGKQTGCENVEKTFNIVVSAGAPTITITDIDGAFKKGASVPVTLKLKSDSDSAMEAKLNGGSKTDESLSFTAKEQKTVSDSLTVSSEAAKETVTVTYTVTDQYGQSNSEKVSYVVDNKDPSLNFTAVTPYVINDITGEKSYINGTIKATFNASDNYELEDVKWECYEAAYTVANATTSFFTEDSDHNVTSMDPSLTKCTDPALSGTITGDEKFGKDVEIDTTKICNNAMDPNDPSDKSYMKHLVILFTAKDKAGNEVQRAKQYIVNQESDKPRIAPSNFSSVADKDIAANKNLFGVTGNNKLLGGIEDDDGVKTVFVWVEYATAFEDGSDPEKPWGTVKTWKKIPKSMTNTDADGKILLRDNETSTSINLNNGTSVFHYPGKYKAVFEVHDVKFKDETTTPFNRAFSEEYFFGVSDGAPKIEVQFSDELPTGNYIKSNKSLGSAGLVKVDAGAKPVAINDIAYIPSKLTTTSGGTLSVAGGDGDYSFTDSFTTAGANESSTDVTYTVVDIFGQENKGKLTYTIDDTAPEFYNGSPDTGKDYTFKIANKAYTSSVWYSGDDLSIEGYYMEKHSGIKEVSYTFTPMTAAGLGSPVKDKWPATKVWTNPANGNVYYKFQGTIASVPEFAGSTLVFGTEDGAGTASVGENTLYNAANNETSLIINMDKTAPTDFAAKLYSVDGGITSSGEAKGNVLVNCKQNVTLYGTLSDGASGIDQVNFKFGTSVTGTVKYSTSKPSDLTDWTEWKTIVDDSTNGFENYDAAKAKLYKTWSVKITASDIKSNATTGSADLSVEFRDRAGNKNSSSVLTFAVDTTAPSVTLNTPIVDSEVNGKNNVSGTVEENRSLKKMMLYYKVASTLSNPAKETTLKTPADYGWTAIAVDEEKADADKVYEKTNVGEIYSWNFKNFNFNKEVNADGEATLWILPVVTDEAGNCNAYNIEFDADTEVSKYTWKFTIEAKKYNVRMDKDRPVIKVNNLVDNNSGSYGESGYRPNYILKFGTQSRCEGSVSDDDSTASSVVKKILASSEPITSDAGWTETSTGSGEWKHKTGVDGEGNDVYEITKFVKSTGEWTFTPADVNDGNKTVYFYIEDNAGGKFYTAYDRSTGSASDYNATLDAAVSELDSKLNKPKCVFKDRAEKDSFECQKKNGDSYDAVEYLMYKADKTSPSVTDAKVVVADKNDDPVDMDDSTEAVESEISVQNQILGGTKRQKAILKITSQDSNGIAGVSVKISGKLSNGADSRGSTEKDFELKYTTAALLGEDQYKASDKWIQLDSGFVANEDNLSNTLVLPEIDFAEATHGLEGYAGSLSVEVNAYDSCGLKGNGNYSFNIDMAGPNITISSPDSTTAMTGPVKILGSCTDIGKAGASVLEYKIPGSGDEWGGARGGSSLIAWNYVLDGSANPMLDKKNGVGDYVYLNSTVSTETSSGSNIWDVPVHFRAEDALGNVTEETGFSVRYDPDGDKPTVIITYPKLADGETSATLGGLIRVTGNAEIPSMTSVAKTAYLQIQHLDGGSWVDYTRAYLTDPDHGGYTYHNATEAGIVAGLASGDTTWWGVKADVPSSSWSIKLNAKDEFNPESGTNNIRIRACAVNRENKVGAWSDWVPITVDNAAPKATVSLEQFSNYSVAAVESGSLKRTNFLEYDSGMYIRGQWYIVLDVKDESGVNASSATLTGAGTTFASVKTDHPATAQAGHDNYKFYIPVTTTNGEAKYTFSVPDWDSAGGGNAHTYTAEFQLNIDNTKPTIGEVKGGDTVLETAGQKIKDSNYVFSIEGKSEEADSGFARALFYFVRDTTVNGKTMAESVYLDPLDTGRADYENKTKFVDSGVTKVQKLYVKDVANDGTNNFEFYGKVFAGTQSSKSSFTVTETLSDPHVKVGGLVYFGTRTATVGKTEYTGGNFARITGISGNTVSFDKETDGAQLSVAFVYGQSIDNTYTEKIKGGNSLNPFQFDNDDGDFMHESIENMKPDYTWKGTIHSTNIPDGPATLVCLVFDKAGNVEKKSFDVFVANNAPRIAKVYFGTNLNGSVSSEKATFEKDEFMEYDWYAKDGLAESKEIETAKYKNGVYGETYNEAPFKIKNGLAVVPEIVGGNGSLKMVLDNSASSGDPVTGSGVGVDTTVDTSWMTTSDSELSSSFKAFTLDNKALNGGTAPTAGSNNDGTGKGMSFTFWDETEETTQGTDSQNAVIYVTDFTVALIDKTKPNVVVNKFFWKSSSENSLFGNSRDNGHIELEEDLEGGTWAGYTADVPKVSGKIVLRGTAYDDSCLSELYIAFGKVAQVKAASYADGKWTLEANAITDDNGWEFKVYDNKGSDTTDGGLAGNNAVKMTSDIAKKYFGATGTDTAVAEAVKSLAYFGQSGHKVAWELSVDTEKAVAGFAELGVIGTVSAKDTAGNDSSDRSASETAGDENMHRQSYTMDVVPYVTKVKTKMSTVGDEWSTYGRTALGHYVSARTITSNTPTGEDIEVYGFNLSGGTVSGKTAANANAGSATLAAGTGCQTFNNKDFKSGTYTVTVSSVASINNVNNDDAEYNKYGNTTTNENLVDGFELDVWDIRTDAAKTLGSAMKEGIMRIAPGSDKLGFAFTNGAARFSMAGSSNDKSYKVFQRNYADFDNVAFIYDEKGYSYGTASGLDTYPDGNKDMGGRFTLQTSRWGVGQNDMNDNYYSKNKLRLESIGVKNAYVNGTWMTTCVDPDPDRFHSPQLASAVHGNDTTIYLAYYDSFNSQIRFRYGTINTTGDLARTDWVLNETYANEDNRRKNNGFGQLQDEHHASGTNYQKQCFDAHTDDFSLLAGKSNLEARTDTGNTCYALDARSSTCLAIDAIKGSTTAGDVVVAVWSTGTGVKYAWKHNPCNDHDASTTTRGSTTDGSSFTNDGYWSAPRDIFTGECSDVTIKADADGGIHIAAYSVGKQALVYRHISSFYGTLGSEVVVDAYNRTGSRANIDVQKEGGFCVPYISYYHSGSAHTKMAYLVAKNADETAMNYSAQGAVNKMYTGNWEVTEIPTSSSIKEDHTSMGLWKTAAGVKRTPSSGGDTNGNRGDSDGETYGNGTDNPVVGYVTNVGTRGYFEVAQKR